MSAAVRGTSRSARITGKFLVLDGRLHEFDAHRKALAQSRDDLVGQHLGRRCAGRHAHDRACPDLAERHILLALHEESPPGPGPLRHLDEPARIRGVRRADDEEEIRPRCRRLHGVLAVGRGVADGLGRRRLHLGEAALQRLDDAGRILDRERRLRDEAERRRIGRLQGSDVLLGLDQRHAPSGSCPIVPTTSGWPRWPISSTCRPRRM